ncbi:outer membrane protein assembly factor BamB family protein [Jiangella alkaliphila]|uniref:3',5'-cyclic AMP phosphodiesterase CpdA n=1 Tax=Jiangella alkaliphila TaxID=419479 RepID=A0A1H2LGY7_9ACTN|nr:PQQ-binding-like beta-propeller repeat protein [Jiangella alkaliphila]SDU80287.1 3',5'-cyclic AMP phosphodiesterase CpdA [Jiangella alkaliphila]
MSDTPEHTIDRRRFLGVAGVGAAGALAATSGLGGLVRPARAAATGTATPAASTAPSLRFAVVTDTHASPEEPVRLQLLPRVFQSIDRANPDFVMNCGDITDYGGGAEFDAYLSTVPETLRPRMRHVPGNHEVRWDVNAGQLYQETFGPAPYTFDLGGVRLIGLDPTQLLQEPGHFGPERLSWLASAIGGPAPAVLFQHFPYGADHYYVNDQDAFFATVAGSPVRAVFAGHVHAEGVYRFNGFTQVTGAATRNAALYYWVERVDDAGHPVLRVWVVTVAIDGVETRRELTTIPLDGDGAGRLLAPGRVVIDLAAGGALDVRVEVPRDGAPAQVRAQLYPQHVFGGRNAGAWVPLAAPGRSRWWSATVDAAALPPGAHRLQLRVVGADGATHESTASFELPPAAGTPGRRWSRSLPGSVQGALTVTPDGLVVAGSTGGAVVLVDPRRGGRARWTASTGPVLRASAVTDDSVFVPSADHRLSALSLSTGEERWSVDAGAPVLSAPLVTVLGSTEAVVFAAGRTLFAVAAADGAELWRADLGGFFAGRAACDGARVYAGSGDGYAYAFDAVSGERLWRFSTTTRTNTYGRLLYGAWDDTVELLPGGLVLFATVASTFAVDAATGVQRWQVASGCMYPPSGLTPHGLFLVDEWGRFQLVDPATGTRRWYAELGARTLNAGPVIAGDTAWVVATTGLLAGVDVATGTIEHRLQTGPANTFSTPVVVDGVLVFGDQDGGLHGIDLP